jgi:hypothetical protein
MDEQRKKSPVHDIGKARPGRYQILFCYSELNPYYSSILVNRDATTSS